MDSSKPCDQLLLKKNEKKSIKTLRIPLLSTVFSSSITIFFKFNYSFHSSNMYKATIIAALVFALDVQARNCKGGLTYCGKTLLGIGKNPIS